MIDAVAVRSKKFSVAAQPSAGAPAKVPMSTDWSAIVDTVELARGEPAGARPSESATIRRELVARVRAQVAAGTYLTDEKLDSALDRMRRELMRER